MSEIQWENIRFRASSFGQLMSESKDKKNPIGKTCAAELIKIYNQEVYGRKRDITTKHMDKGKRAEDESIKLFSIVEGKMFYKNEDRLENEWFTGHSDIFTGDHVESAEEIWDIKTRWDLDSFMPKLVEDCANGEELQLQVYFDLTGANSGGIANTLVDCPPEILMEEKRRLLYSMNVVSEENPEYLKAAAELEHLLTFSDIPLTERVIKQPVTRNDELIEKMKQKVPIMRQWLQEFHEKHMNLYPQSENLLT